MSESYKECEDADTLIRSTYGYTCKSCYEALPRRDQIALCDVIEDYEGVLYYDGEYYESDCDLIYGFIDKHDDTPSVEDLPRFIHTVAEVPIHEAVDASRIAENISESIMDEIRIDPSDVDCWFRLDEKSLGTLITDWLKGHKFTIYVENRGEVVDLIELWKSELEDVER